MAPTIRFSIFQILIATTAIALVIAFQWYWPAFILLATLAVNFFVPAIYMRLQRLKLWIAKRLVPTIYSWRLLWLSRMIFGRGILARALSDYGLKMALQNRHTIAINLFTRALELDDSEAAYWTNRGATYYCCENFEQASLDLTRALSINPTQEVAKAYRGFIRFGQGDYLGSLVDLSGIEFSESQHAIAAFFRGYANEELGNWQQAIDDYRRSYELERSQKVAAISIARIQAGCPDDSIRDGRKALENAATICFQTEWKDWMVVSVYAAAWAEVGDFESACKYAQMALDLAPENEKPERASRLSQFQNRIPFRILQNQQQT